MNREPSPESSNRTKDRPLESFSDQLQELAVEQARRIINLSLYTKSLLSALPVVLLATDQRGYIHTLNHAAEEILGLREEQLRGRLLTDLFLSNPEITDKVMRTLKKGRHFHMGSESVCLASGKELIGNLYIQPLRDEEQKICGLLLTVEDQTYVHFLRDAFRRYVPPSVSEMIAQEPQQLELGGEEKILSVLFSDLKNFTSFAERLSPHEMVTLLSDYFTEMTDQIFAYEGTLKEYVGDELMAIFGAPIEQVDHAKRACASALDMQDRLRSLRKSWTRLGRPSLRARIGINSGPMLVGNLGSPYRFSYGVIGDQVNLGSRLEGLSEVYGTEILIGENTADLVKGSFLLRQVDWVRVKGRTQTARIYELVDRSGAILPENKDQAFGCYSEGLEAYRQQLWQEALSHFERALALWPKDGPSGVMARRCREYLETPPRAEWDGVFQHLKKM